MDSPASDSALALHHRSYGNPRRPAVVLLHGLFGSGQNWGSVARRLEGRFHVVVPDLRNHGQSPHAERHDYPGMAADLVALLDRLELPRSILVGHSMGGKVAMLLALSAPQRVAALAVVDIAPVTYGHDFDDVLAAFRAVDLAGLGGRGDAERQMAPWVQGAGVRAFLLQNLVRGSDGWRWRLNVDALAAGQRDILSFPAAAGIRYPGPTQFIHGELSDYVTGADIPIDGGWNRAG